MQLYRPPLKLEPIYVSHAHELKSSNPRLDRAPATALGTCGAQFAQTERESVSGGARHGGGGDSSASLRPGAPELLPRRFAAAIGG
jgi:hypothetical protein